MANVHRSPKLLACCVLAFLLLAIGVTRGSVASADNLLPETPALRAPARITIGADVRSGPGERYLVLTVAQAGEQHAILGRSSDGLWWRIDFRGHPAWVAAAQVETQATDVPVVRVGGERL
jgi:uncharacterized protein YgiM (DUF1202 family)